MNTFCGKGEAVQEKERGGSRKFVFVARMSDSTPAAAMAGAMPSAGASTGTVEGSQKQEGAAAEGTKAATGAMLTEEAAVAIFVAKHTHTTRDSLSCKLAQQYVITSKSVRGASYGLPVCLPVG